jgi:hypothetical protein
MQALRLVRAHGWHRLAVAAQRFSDEIQWPRPVLPACSQLVSRHSWLIESAVFEIEPQRSDAAWTWLLLLCDLALAQCVERANFRLYELAMARLLLVHMTQPLDQWATSSRTSRLLARLADASSVAGRSVKAMQALLEVDTSKLAKLAFGTCALLRFELLGALPSRLLACYGDRSCRAVGALTAALLQPPRAPHEQLAARLIVARFGALDVGAHYVEACYALEREVFYQSTMSQRLIVDAAWRRCRRNLGALASLAASPLSPLLAALGVANARRWQELCK